MLEGLASALKKFLNYDQTLSAFREGACIVESGQLIAAAFTRQLYNPQCFLQYKDPTVPPPDWNVRHYYRRLQNVCKAEPFTITYYLTYFP